MTAGSWLALARWCELFALLAESYRCLETSEALLTPFGGNEELTYYLCRRGKEGFAAIEVGFS